jgi:hypothetical protein
MSTTKSTSLRIPESILQKIEEKCPNVNRSRLISNVFEYILSQSDEVIADFIKKAQ